MAKVFEIRLLELWEARHGAEEREAAQQASLRAAMELLALEEGAEDGQGGGDGSAAGGAAGSSGAGLKERRKRQKRRKREAAKEALGEQREALRAAELRATASREEG